MDSPMEEFTEENLSELSEIDPNRGVNFTEYEKELLLKLSQKYLDVISSRDNAEVSLQMKSDAWHEIALQFNNCPGVHVRTAKALKKCLANIKQRAKKRINKYGITGIDTIEDLWEEMKRISYHGNLIEEFVEEPEPPKEVPTSSITVIDGTDYHIEPGEQTDSAEDDDETTLSAQSTREDTVSKITGIKFSSSHAAAIATRTRKIPIQLHRKMNPPPLVRKPISLTPLSHAHQRREVKNSNKDDNQQFQSSKSDDSSLMIERRREELKLIKQQRKYERREHRMRKKEHMARMTVLLQEQDYWLSLTKRAAKQDNVGSGCSHCRGSKSNTQMID